MIRQTPMGPQLIFLNEDMMIDTIRVSDGERSFETAISHFRYHDGKLVIVQAYDTWSEAVAGHESWIATMTRDPLPEYLRGAENDIFSQILDLMEGEESNVFPLQNEKK